MSKDFVNLDQIVREWANDEYDSTANASQRRLRKKEKSKKTKYLELHIDWSNARFNDVTTWGPEGVTNGAAHPQQQRQSSLDPAEPTASVLFETKFVNNTKETQEYTMHTEKSTRSSIETVIEKGITKGVEMGIKLMTPCEVFEANVGFKREVTLTNVEGQTYEEELVWGVDSLIRVNPLHVAEASLVVDERKQKGEFVIETSISGMVYVTFTNARDNNSFVKDTGHDIAEIVRDYIEKEKYKRDLSFVRIEGNTVKVRTKGSCKFRYGVSQRIKVNQREITPDDV